MRVDRHAIVGVRQDLAEGAHEEVTAVAATAVAQARQRTVLGRVDLQLDSVAAREAGAGLGHVAEARHVATVRGKVLAGPRRGRGAAVDPDPRDVVHQVATEDS